MMPTKIEHTRDPLSCPCTDCVTLRLIYELVCARNVHRISFEDCEKGIMILRMWQAMEEL